MSLRRFLDSAYVLIVEEYQRIGVNLIEALEKTANLRAHTAGGNGEVVVAPEEAQVARQNEASMAELQKMMKGLGVV